MAKVRFEPADGPFAVAVSGGADSLALALLAADFAPCHFLTFDHGLRPGSIREAEKVKDWLRGKGLSHKTLTWTGKKPKTGIQAAARTARYKALESWCKNNAIRYLFIGHHLEDQAETFLMRLLKGSGIDGLAAMSYRTPGLFDAGVTLVRPFLGLSKARLVATLMARGQDWIEDPSNENKEFTRIKIRKLLETSKYLDAKTLAAMAARLSAVKGFLDDLTADLVGKSVRIFPAGYATIALKGFLGAPPEICLRALSKILTFISQADYPPKLDKLERLLRSLGKKGFPGATLGGCCLAPVADDKVLVCREPRDASEVVTLKPGQGGMWDGRFRVALTAAPGQVEIRALGDKAWQNLVREHPEIREIEIPHPARAALPAFFLGDEPVLVPHLRFSAGTIEGSAVFGPKQSLLR